MISERYNEKKSPAILKISSLLHLAKQALTVDHFHNIKSQIITERTEGRPVHESNLAIGPERENLALLPPLTWASAAEKGPRGLMGKPF